MEFGQLLRRCRRAAGLTQEELDERAGVGVRTIRDLERGQRTRPYRQTVGALAEALGLRGPQLDEFVRLSRQIAAGPKALDREVLDGHSSLNPAQAPGPVPPETAGADMLEVPVPRELPAAVAGFTGRDSELAALDALLDNSPAGSPLTMLITAIGGTAGVGKTALAVQWAHQTAGSFPAGQLYVNLCGYVLPLSDAVSLLRTLIGGRVDAEPEAAAVLAAHCCRLPLAVRVAAEMAVARLGASLASLAAELADQQQRLDLLDAGGDPSTAVRAVFSWSARHLNSDTVRAFRLMGVHPGPDLDACAAAALNLGDVNLRQGRDELAGPCLRQSLALSRHFGDRVGEAAALAGLGELDLRQGRYQYAARQLHMALALSREAGARSSETNALHLLGEVSLATCDHRQACTTTPARSPWPARPATYICRPAPTTASPAPARPRATCNKSGTTGCRPSPGTHSSARPRQIKSGSGLNEFLARTPARGGASWSIGPV